METRHQFMKKVFMVLPFCLFTFLPSNAQTFTQRVQQTKQGEGTVVIHQDKAIEDLVNKPVAGNNAAAPKKQSEGKATTTTSPNKETKEKPSTTTAEKSDTLGNEKKLARGIRMNGYRVQVFAGGNSRKDRQQAEAARNRIKALFPETAVSVHFHSPRWICRAGNFRTYEEAHKMLEDVKAIGYNSAIIIKTKITVQ